MSNILNYCFNVVLSVGLLEAFKEITQKELFDSVLDLVLMLVMVFVSRFLTNYLERKYKKFLFYLKKRFKS